MQLGLHRLAQPRSPTSSLGVCHFNPQRYDQRPSYSAAQRLAPGCSTYPWVSKSGRKQQPSQATAELSSGVPIDRGAGGHHPPPPIKHTGGDGGQEPEGAAADDALAKAGIKAGDLPEDMQDARSRGQLQAKDVQAWVKYSNLPVLGLLCKLLPSFRDRVMGNPRFLLVLAIEVIIGGSAKLSAEKEFRKEHFKQEINMVASDMALEIIADVTVVWLLSTKASFKPPSKSAFARWSRSLPAHAFQVGDFTLAQRASNVLLRACQFLAVGFGSSVVGHSLTTRMVEEQRKKAPKGQQKDTELAPVLPNSLGWGSFMALSANSRYQIINGIEERVLDVFVNNAGAKALLTLLLRFTNTYSGGLQWMWYASKIGLQ